MVEGGEEMVKGVIGTGGVDEGEGEVGVGVVELDAVAAGFDLEEAKVLEVLLGGVGLALAPGLSTEGARLAR